MPNNLTCKYCGKPLVTADLYLSYFNYFFCSVECMENQVECELAELKASEARQDNA